MLQTFTSTRKWYFSITLHYPSTEEKAQKKVKSPRKLEIKTTFIIQKIAALRRCFKSEVQFLKSTLKSILLLRVLSECKCSDNAHSVCALLPTRGDIYDLLHIKILTCLNTKLVLFCFFLIISSRQPGNGKMYCNVQRQACDFTVQGKNSSSIKNAQNNLEQCAPPYCKAQSHF